MTVWIISMYFCVYFPIKTLPLEGELVLENIIFHYKQLILEYFTWGEVHSVDQH